MPFQQIFHLFQHSKKKVPKDTRNEQEDITNEPPPYSISSLSSSPPQLQELEFQQSRDLLKLDFFHTDVRDMNTSFAHILKPDTPPPVIPKANSLRRKISAYRLIRRSRSSPDIKQ